MDPVTAPDDPEPTGSAVDRRDASGPVPAPPGTRLSRASWHDLDDVAELYRLVEVDRVGEADTRPVDVRHRWLAHAGFDDTLLVRDAATGRLLAYAEFHDDTDPWTDELDLYLEGRIAPDRTGHGLASFLLERAVQRARLAARRRGDPTAVLRTTVTDGDDAALDWYARRGFVPVRHFLHMRLDLDERPPAPRWPDGVAARPVTEAELRTVWRVHQASFADLPTHLPTGWDDWHHDRVGRDPHLDLGLWWVAEAEDEVVGICLGRASTPEGAELGHVRDLGVLPSWRRRGVGMALLRTLLREFHARGLTGVALEVDDVTLDGAVALYRAAGLRIVRRRDVLALELAVTPAGHPAPAPG